MRTVLDIRRPKEFEPSHMQKWKSIQTIPKNVPISNRSTNWYDYIRIGTMEEQAPEPRDSQIPPVEEMIEFWPQKQDQILEKARLLSIILQQELLLPKISSEGEYDWDTLQPYRFGEVLKSNKLQELAIEYFSKLRPDQLEQQPYRKVMWRILQKRVGIPIKEEKKQEEEEVWLPIYDTRAYQPPEDEEYEGKEDEEEEKEKEPVVPIISL